MLSALLGQPRALRALQAAAQGASAHHAYLFLGPEGVGKELAAVAFAQALLCSEAKGLGCGKCDTCVRVGRRGHPDVTWVMPEDEQVRRKLAGKSDFTGTPSRDIRVDQIRALQERLALRGLESNRKLAVVLSAHRMNEAAQNAFLKTLEEPPRGTLIILVASLADRLKPTIRSRCSQVLFGPLPEALVAKLVGERRKLPEDKAQVLAAVAQGSMSVAMGTSVELLEEQRTLLERFEALDFTDARPLLALADELSASREDAEAALVLLEGWTRDVAVAQLGSLALRRKDLLPLAQTVAAKLTARQLHRRHALIGVARDAISRNGAPRLSLEKFLLEFSEELR